MAEEETAVEETVEDAATVDETEDEPLRPEGKKALEATKARLKAANAKAKAAEERAEALASAQMSEQEKAVEAARKEASETSSSKYRTRIITSEIKAAAGGKLADPGDAVRLLDLNQFELDDNDELDPQALEKAIAGLLKAKPYLAADKPRFTGSADQGARSTPTLGEAIATATAAKDWRTVGQLKAQQLRDLGTNQT